MKRNLTPILKRNRLELGNGMKVRIFGQLDFYAPTGRLGLKMAGIDPRFTLGELSQARDQVVRPLVAGGLFDANRARRLSPIPLRVGVVASVGTAAWHDFRDELERSGFGFHLAVCDTRVQGEWAVPMVAAAIRTLARRGDLDCIVVIRGGGARNELATFDAESIAVAIATSPMPVLTGLGHEIDRSVADEVAHTALKTPTACAGALIDAVHDYLPAAERSWAAIAAVARQDLGSVTGALVRSGAPHRPSHARRGRARRRAAHHPGRTVRLAPPRQVDAPSAGSSAAAERLRRSGAADRRRRAAPTRWRSPLGWRCSIRSTCCAVGGASPVPPTAACSDPSPTLAAGDVIDHARRRRRVRQPRHHPEVENHDQRTTHPDTPRR